VVDALGRFPAIVTLDNHYVRLGQGVMIGAALARTGVRAEFRSLGLTDVPVCGNNAEVLAHHGLDAAGIAAAVQECVAKSTAATRRAGFSRVLKK
jgi:transketolase